jgi:hypothetical protein
MLDEAIAAALAARAEAEPAWDAMPVVFLIFVQGRHVTLTPLEVRGLVWEMPGGPPEGLMIVAMALRKIGMRPDGPGENGTLHGVAFMHEGHEVTATDHHSDVLSQQLLSQGRGRLKQHPLSREMRGVTAVDCDRTAYQIRLYRDTGEVTTLVMKPDGEYQPSGLVMEALDHILETLTGTPMPVRPDDHVMDERNN